MSKKTKEKQFVQNKEFDKTSKLSDARNPEVTWLVIAACLSVVYLTGMLVLSLVYSTRQISAISLINPNISVPELQIILLCVYTGTLGSSVMALRSIIDRIANGWELSNGNKLPKDQPADKFVGKMLPGFLVRPFLGSAAGFLVFLAITAGYWIAISPNSSVEFSPYGLGFLAFLGGLFAKTFFVRLKGVFDKSFAGP